MSDGKVRKMFGGQLFAGRASREEFCDFLWFLLFAGIGFGMLCGMLAAMTGGAVPAIANALGTSGVVALAGLFTAKTVRRLHDVGESGWRILIALVPFAGILILAIETLGEGEPGPNKYGPNPKKSP